MRRLKAPRIGAVALIVAAVILNVALPTRYRVGPEWLPSIAAAIVFVPMVADILTRGNPLWVRIERAASFAGVGIVFVLNTANLVDVVYSLVTNSRTMDPVTLFYTSVAIWVGNMFIFTLAYWLIDRGGPDARAGGDTSRYPDFDFPAMDDPQHVPPGWHPGIVDYLFLGFTTSTAFSPTEAMPLTARAKILVMAQSSISLVTIAVVAARTVNILQG